MSTVFALLFLATVVLLIWGIVSPKSLSKFSGKPLTRKDAGLSLGFFAVLFIILTGMTVPPQQNSNTADKSGIDEISSVESSQEEQEKAPIITSEEVTETEAVPFESKTVQSASLDKGTTQVTTPGVNGVKTRTYKVTYEDGKETERTLIKEEVTTQPITEVTTVGTKVAAPKPVSNCDPNYSGACVPIASDVDCAGGSGNGPAYVSGPVTVVGYDKYDLDRDGNGIGCE